MATDEVQLDDTTVPSTLHRESTNDQVLELLREANRERKEQGQAFASSVQRQAREFTACLDAHTTRFSGLIAEQGKEMRQAINRLTLQFIGVVTVLVLVQLLVQLGQPFLLKAFGLELDTRPQTPVLVGPQPAE